MTDDGTITNKVLFDHIQLGRKETRSIKKDLERLEKKVDEGFADVDRRFQKVNRKFDEASEQREGIKDDLEATIKMQYKHEKELAMLAGRPMPEDY